MNRRSNRSRMRVLKCPLVVFCAVSLFVACRPPATGDNSSPAKQTATDDPEIREKARLLRKRGDALSEEGQLLAAIQAYNEALDLNPNDGEVHYRLGLAHYQVGDLHRSVADFSAAIQFGPADANVFTNRASVYRELGRLDDALADCVMAIQLDPQYARAFEIRAYVHHDAGDLRRAMAELKKPSGSIQTYLKCI